mmetsp:Transcript_18011/g.26219  ORF Transcript_18011/g.26219 Transcript_18011/m.26219 type:complete len:233 (+) Transcript_18011:174-872(+)
MAERIQVSVSDAPLEDWSEGLCSFSFKYCCFALCCPVCANASARSRFDDSNWCFNLFIGLPATRNLIREGYRIEGGCVTDILISCCCPICSVAQLLNEVDRRGSVTAEYGTNRSPVEIPWDNGLFSCFKSCNNCLCGLCCAPCALAQARTNYDGGDFIFTLLCFSPCLTRSVIREGYNIEGTCFSDIIFPTLCYSCTACQLLNEVNSRGRVTKTHVQAQVMARENDSLIRRY